MGKGWGRGKGWEGACSSQPRSRGSFLFRKPFLICCSIERSPAGCVVPICSKAAPTSHAGQMAHAAPTGVLAPARPRYEMSSPEPAEMPIIPTKEARG